MRSYPKRETTGRKQGGQKGHVGKGRKLKPLEQVKRVVANRPTACEQCGALLVGEDHHPQRHQVSELPRIEPEIIEYQLHTLTCLVCGRENQAEWPADMPKGSFGERLQATLGYLGGRFGVKPVPYLRRLSLGVATGNCFDRFRPLPRLFRFRQVRQIGLIFRRSLVCGQALLCEHLIPLLTSSGAAKGA